MSAPSEEFRDPQAEYDARLRAITAPKSMKPALKRYASRINTHHIWVLLVILLWSFAVDGVLIAFAVIGDFFAALARPRSPWG
ncbi:MAG: hypothetical protein AAFQ84_03650 [Pseudomonadota bacterium]